MALVKTLISSLSTQTGGGGGASQLHVPHPPSMPSVLSQQSLHGSHEPSWKQYVPSPHSLCAEHDALSKFRFPFCVPSTSAMQKTQSSSTDLIFWQARAWQFFYIRMSIEHVVSIYLRLFRCCLCCTQRGLLFPGCIKDAARLQSHCAHCCGINVLFTLICEQRLYSLGTVNVLQVSETAIAGVKVLKHCNHATSQKTLIFRINFDHPS